ncbi:MFS transporter [Pleurocapsales cyanobacterium LEGE 06147]|nr:MFS transporter [Pleurocapsales cyanobacterium LEGE 06147]
MFQAENIILNISTTSLLGQTVVPPTPAPPEAAAESTALIFSGPQFFSALVAGVMLAFAFQLLFTNLGVASGISLLGRSSDSDSHADSEQKHSASLGGTLKRIGFAVGLGTLISVTLALFLACLLAVRLSLFVSPVSGAIVGLVIWATFFSLMVWLSSTTVGSLIGSVVNTATSGVQALVGTATAAIGSRAASDRVVATAEAAATAVRRELGAAIDPVTMRENVEELLQSVRKPELDIEQITKDFERLLEDEELDVLANNDRLREIDRQTFVQLISDRTDLSKREIDRIADRLESVWKNKINKSSSSGNPVAELANYLKSASKEELLGSDLSQQLKRLREDIMPRRQSQSQQGSGPLTQVATMGLNSLIGMLMGRTDLSDLDIEKIVAQLQQAKDFLGEQTDKVATQVGVKEPTPFSPIRSDIENYLLNAYPWQLKQSNLNVEFRDLFYDPEADPQAVINQLQSIQRRDFVELLEQKGLLTQEQIQSTADQLEAIRLEVLATAEAAREREENIALLAEVENYLVNTPKEDLSPEKIWLNFKPILENPDITHDQLNNRLMQLDRPTFERLLTQRGDLNEVEISAIITELEMTRDRVLQESRETFGAAKAKAQRQWLHVQSYLRDTGKEELNPEAIKRELQLLLEEPEAGTAALQARLAQFDRDTLVKLLSQRQDVSEEEIEKIIDEVEGVWIQARSLPGQLMGKAEQQYERATSAIAQYLRDTGKEELNPEGIRNDLTLLLNDPKLGARAIRHRLAEMDRDTLVQLLTQRGDLSEEQVNNIIDEVQSTLRNIARVPRRLAVRTQEKVQDFQSAIADYLRSTDKEELNPEGIRRDLELLLRDPRLGTQSLKDRLSHFDRDTLVALLSQREDISEADVNRIVDQILSVRERFMSQLQAIQARIQSVIDRILARIRAYLNGLERPELNYDGIKRDLQTLFDDPQAGFEALRDRFSQINRDTLVAVLSSRDDISEADANRMIDQVERTRDRILQRAERIQQQAQLRLEEAKLQAQKQVEETRKAAAAASWWLFFTALISAAASAGAGALGVID